MTAVTVEASVRNLLWCIDRIKYAYKRKTVYVVRSELYYYDFQILLGHSLLVPSKNSACEYLQVDSVRAK